MLVLAFDTSSPAVTVAVVDTEPLNVVAERTEIATNRHGELLAPLIRDVLDAAGAGATDIAAIGVGLGPGPFTGLRVGIVTAKAMGDALRVPTYGECSLDVIARRSATGEDDLAVVTDARRKQVYWRVYNAIGRPLQEPELSPATEVADTLRGRVTHVVGAGAELYREAFGGFTVLDANPYPTAAELGQIVAQRLGPSPSGEDLMPLYLRRPDAQPPGPPKRVTPA